MASQQLTINDAYPLPNITDCLDTLSGRLYLYTLDLGSGYWQVELEEEDKQKTAFVTHQGLYQFCVMPFGLTNAPATFERLMELVLRGLQWHRCLVYLDDIVTFGDSFTSTLDNLSLIFERLQSAGLKLKPSKCCLFQTDVAFLGHRVGREGISCDPEKIRAVEEWSTPKDVKDVRSFVGLASYYRRFIPNFAHTAAPLTDLTKKGCLFSWDEKCEEAFQILKSLLMTAPVLAYPSSDPQSKFVLDTDASDFAVGAVLSQVQGEDEVVIAYASKSLSQSQRKYCTTYRELLAVVIFVQQFRHFLLGKHFIIRTDHNSLRWLRNFRNVEGMVGRWIAALGPFDYTIVHRKGENHCNADALSRNPVLRRMRCGRPECPECPSDTEVTPKCVRQAIEAENSSDIDDDHLVSVITRENARNQEIPQRENNEDGEAGPSDSLDSSGSEDLDRSELSSSVESSGDNSSASSEKGKSATVEADQTNERDSTLVDDSNWLDTWIRSDIARRQ